MQELTNFMQLISTEKARSKAIKEEKEKRFAPRINTSASLADFFTMISEAPRVSRKKEQPADKEMQKEERFPTADERWPRSGETIPQTKIIEKHYIKEVPVEKKVEISEQDNSQRIDILKTFFDKLDHFEQTLNQKELASKMTQYMPEAKDTNELTQLKEQFNHFRKLVTHQMSTIGGGGAVNLLDLDDIDTSSLGNGKFLVYNSTSGKLEFTDQVDGN